MLSRLASSGSYGWLVAGGLLAGIAAGVMIARSATPAAPTPGGCRMVERVVISQLPTSCSAEDELVRATAVIHFFDNEVDYATAEDPMSAKAAALLALPMMCSGATSEYSYPALSRHIESAATIAIQRGDKQTAMALVYIGRAYRADARMLDTLVTSIVK